MTLIEKYAAGRLTPDECDEHSEVLRKSVRALLAVAVAADGVSKRYLKMWQRNANRKDDVLVRALARLSRVSGEGERR